MNIIEYDFDLLKLDGNGQFNDTNRSLYESTVKKRGLEGWNFCHHSFVIVQKEKDEDSCMASYLTWSREKYPMMIANYENINNSMYNHVSEVEKENGPKVFPGPMTFIHKFEEPNEEQKVGFSKVDDPLLTPGVLVDFLPGALVDFLDDPNPVPMSDRQAKAFLEVFQMRLKPYAADYSPGKQTDAIDDAT